jgi:PIN domain
MPLKRNSFKTRTAQNRWKPGIKPSGSRPYTVRGEELVLCLDTNIYLQFFSSSSKKSFDGFLLGLCEYVCNKRFETITVFVPFIVLQELDSMKKTISLAMAAQASILWITSRSLPGLKVSVSYQDLLVDTSSLSLYKCEDPDDILLLSTFSKQQENTNRKLYLVTLDVNLWNKARCFDLSHFRIPATEFVSLIKEL